MKNLITFEEFLNEATKNDNVITIKKLNDINHTRLVKWMHNEFGNKYNPGMQWVDGPLKKGDFELDVTNFEKKDLADLKNYLKYQGYIFEGSVNEGKSTEQEAVYMAPKNRSSLQKYNEKICKIISDEGSNATIKFEDGKTLTEVPKEQLRFIK